MSLKYFIGYSTDAHIRYKSSSGGVGSAFIKYLMESCGYGTSMTFVFNTEECRYEPKLVYKSDQMEPVGSIYQDTDTIRFIKDHVEKIQDGIVVTCMPCQVRPIKAILSRHHIKHFIISLCCSGQTTVQGTWCYYKLMGIKKEDVKCIQYRGNGWPSGIQITLKSGELIKKDNFTYPWTLMHDSLLFRPKRCLNCPSKTSDEADVSLADPWLDEYIEHDHTGNTIVICNDQAVSLIHEMVSKKLIEIAEVDENTYMMSQRGTVKSKQESVKHKKFNRIVGKMGEEGSVYKKMATSSSFFLKVHTRFLRMIDEYIY